jgi:signal transduction histidine kinase
MALRSFQTRVIVSFLILISLVQIGSMVAVHTAIQRSARAHVKKDLETAGKVVGRLLDARKERLVHASRILSGDFAFKQVVALDDPDTLLSAMDNHRARIAAELMMVISLDGMRVIDTLHRPTRAASAVAPLVGIARQAGEVSDFVLVDDRPYQVVVVPLLAPAPIAWIAMGFPIDRAFADELDMTTSAHVSFVHTDASNVATRITPTAPFPGGAESAETVVLPLMSSTGARIDVVLRRSLADAMAPYQPLRTMLLVLFALAAVVSIAGGIWIARDVSQPVHHLAEAARQIEAGQYGATVPLARQDELGALAASFNRMGSAVAEREERLRESEQRYRAMTESAADAVVTADGADLIVSWNEAAERIFGYTEREALGTPLARLLPDGTRAGAGRGLTRDGREIPVELSLGTWETRHGAFRTAIIRDVTERKQLEEQVRQSQKMESVGRLAGGIAHDFNNLLTVISGHAELLQLQLPADEALQRRIRYIREASVHAAEMTKQLLAFSRQQILAPQVLDLNAVVNGIVPMLRRLIGEDIALVTIATPALGRVEADPTQITQIVLNLAVNARDAMPQGGKLTIETDEIELDEAHPDRPADTEPGRYVMLAVTDTGVGMDEATRPHIFEPFFTTKATGKGTGLGLATVYGIVKQSNGTIGVSSEPGRGSTFRIYLPRVEHAETPAPVEPAVSGPGGTETILLVEDNEMLRALACELLRSGGYTVLEARDGADALQITQRYHGPIHLLLTDMVMPEMGGRELAQRMRARRTGMKVLYMSGYAPEGGTDDPFIPKPLEADTVMRKVRELLDLP